MREICLILAIALGSAAHARRNAQYASKGIGNDIKMSYRLGNANIFNNSKYRSAASRNAAL